MPERMFPIQSQRGAKPHPIAIPWPVAELAYSVYSAHHGRAQSLEDLAKRGGFGPGEMDTFLPDWRERCDEIKRLRAALDRCVLSREQGRGEAIIGLTPDEQMVVVQWQEPDWWVHFTPEESRQFAHTLLKKADEAKIQI